MKIEFLGEGKIERKVELKDVSKITITKAPEKEIEIIPKKIEPKFKPAEKEKEPQSSDKKPENKLKRFRFPERISDEKLRNLVKERVKRIAELGWVKDIIADFSKQSADPRYNINDIELKHDTKTIEVIISNGERGVKIVIETYANEREEQNFVANRIWKIIGGENER